MRDLRVEHDGITFAASYTPAGDTAVVAVHGASEGTRDFFLYEHLHRVLPPAGIGVVTFDRRGEGESTGDSSRGRFELQVADVLALARAIDAERLGLWGFSQGGWVGPLAAATSDRVAFLVLIASTGVTPAEQMTYATAEQLRRAGYGDAVVERALGLRHALEDWARGTRRGHDEELAADLVAASDEPWWSLAFLPPVLPDEDERRLVVEEMDFDPRPVFARVSVPTLLFYGEDDAWTPVGPSVRAWREARGDDVDIVVLPHASHELTLPDGTLAPGYERKLLHWLARKWWG